MIRQLYLVLAVMVVLLGLVHLAATFAIFDSLTSRAVWFASGGVSIVLTGLLNLLNRAYGAAASGIRWAAIGANLTMTLFAALAGLADAASGAQFVIIVGLMAATTGLSILPAAAADNTRSGLS